MECSSQAGSCRTRRKRAYDLSTPCTVTYLGSNPPILVTLAITGTTIPTYQSRRCLSNGRKTIPDRVHTRTAVVLGQPMFTYYSDQNGPGGVKLQTIMRPWSPINGSRSHTYVASW